jgi:peptidoglycan/LPS O-acetylase OafA/YrhL
MMFGAGIVAYRRGWLDEIPAAAAKLWRRVAGLMVRGIIVLYFTFGDNNGGGLSAGAFLEAFRESLLCTGMSIGLPALFRKKYSWQSRLTKVLSDNAFTVYLIHIPIVVFLQYLLVGVAIDPLLKFIRKLPVIKHVL